MLRTKLYKLLTEDRFQVIDIFYSESPQKYVKERLKERYNEVEFLENIILAKRIYRGKIVHSEKFCLETVEREAFE